LLPSRRRYSPTHSRSPAFSRRPFSSRRARGSSEKTDDPSASSAPASRYSGLLNVFIPQSHISTFRPSPSPLLPLPFSQCNEFRRGPQSDLTSRHSRMTTELASWIRLAPLKLLSSIRICSSPLHIIHFSCFVGPLLRVAFGWSCPPLAPCTL